MVDVRDRTTSQQPHRQLTGLFLRLYKGTKSETKTIIVNWQWDRGVVVYVVVRSHPPFCHSCTKEQVTREQSMDTGLKGICSDPVYGYTA